MCIVKSVSTAVEDEVSVFAIINDIISAFRAGALLRWKTELVARIIPENRDLVRKAREIESDWVTDQDAYNWNKISILRNYLAKDSIDEKSLFTLLIFRDMLKSSGIPT